MNLQPLETQDGLDETTLVKRLLSNIRSVYLGSAVASELVVTALCAAGHVLIEDAPGVGKTTLAHSLARSIECKFQRVQFTPDLLPADLLGLSILNPATRKLEWTPGPVFTNILLADEINRTNPRTQAALLEAMAERQVTIEGQTRPLAQPFMVMATQNPADSHGTYPLPESQLDRFLLRLKLGYPSFDNELAMLKAQQLTHPIDVLGPVMNATQLCQLQQKTRSVHVSEELLDHLVRFAQLSRQENQLRLGLSPRGTLALRRAAQALAFVRGRDFVKPFDVKTLLVPVCAHRVQFNRLRSSAEEQRKVLEQLYAKAEPPL